MKKKHSQLDNHETLSRFADGNGCGTERKGPQIPSKFSTGFLARLDGRYLLVKELKTFYDAIISDLGGTDNLSTIQKTLVERYVWTIAFLRSLEQKIPTCDASEGAELLGRFTQATNTAIGLAKTLGLKRTAKPVVSLENYIGGKRQ